MRLLRPLFFVVIFASGLAAQQAEPAPKWEIFGGYSFQRSDLREYFKSTPIIYTARGRYANLSGWDISVTENLNRWFGGTVDISGHYKNSTVAGVPNRNQTYSLLYGPRLSYRQGWGVPFAHTLFGVAYSRAKVTPIGPRASDFAFATAIGGGFDLSIGRRAAIRVFQADYFRTNALGLRPNGYRVSAGVVLVVR